MAHEAHNTAAGMKLGKEYPEWQLKRHSVENRQRDKEKLGCLCGGLVFGIHQQVGKAGAGSPGLALRIDE